MAKVVDKTPAKTKKASGAKSTTAKASAPKKEKKPAVGIKIEDASSLALTKLKELELDKQLQSDLEWCLGSYGYDQNPSGLYEMIQRAIAVFKAEKTKKTKGVTAKLITDLEKATKQ